MPARPRQRAGGVKRETGGGGYQIVESKSADFACIFPIFLSLTGGLLAVLDII